MKINYIPALLTLLLLVSPSAFSQHSLQGKVLDQEQNPVAYANIILLNAEDSTSVHKGTVSSENGTFHFQDIPTKEYVLKASFVGFKDFLQRIEVSEDQHLGSFVLELDHAQLEEVSLTVKNPTIHKEVDRLVFKVENSTLSSGSTWGVLKKTPMVISVSDNLQVRNQPVEVYINDRQVHLSASELRVLLENYSAENIKSVEVITNPPARYDAEGGSILNIVTTRPISPGYKGSLSGTLTQAIYPKYRFGTSHYLKTEKLNVFANYSFSPRKEFKEDDSHINFMNNQTVFQRWESDFERTTRSKAHNANVMLDYYLDDRNTLSFSTNALISPGKTFENKVATDISGAGATESFLTNSSLEEDLFNIGMDLEYRHKLKKEGAQISSKVHFTQYDQERFQMVSTDYPERNITNSFHTDAGQDIEIVTGQVDYVTPLGTTHFEAGAKASIINSESGIDYFDSEDDLNGGLSDNFLYEENIYATYASISKDWESWSIKGGLRGEFTDRKGDSRSMEQVDSREYFELFPTFYLMHSLSANHSFSFDYSRRIQRPHYESLNPFRYFLNEHNYNVGNPDLTAAISNNFNLNYTLKGQYFFDLYYRDNGPSTETLSFQDNEALTLRSVSVNLLESISYGLDLTHGRALTDFWYAYAYMSFFHEEQTFIAEESGNMAVTAEIYAFYGTMGNSFTLSRDGSFTGDLYFTYVSDWMTGSYNFDPMTTLSIGLRKTLWNNRAEVSLNLEDILDQTNTRLTSDYLNQDNSFLAMPESRYIRIGFKYNFGNFRLSDNKRAIQAAERERL